MKKSNLLLAFPLGVGIILAGCAEEEPGEPEAEDVEMQNDNQEPDLTEEPNEEEGNTGMDEEEPDLDEEPSEEQNSEAEIGDEREVEETESEFEGDTKLNKENTGPEEDVEDQ